MDQPPLIKQRIEAICTALGISCDHALGAHFPHLASDIPYQPAPHDYHNDIASGIISKIRFVHSSLAVGTVFFFFLFVFLF